MKNICKNTFELLVQINGKLRAKIEVPLNITSKSSENWL